jgi:hypothetical protein
LIGPAHNFCGCIRNELKKSPVQVTVKNLELTSVVEVLSVPLCGIRAIHGKKSSAALCALASLR